MTNEMNCCGACGILGRDNTTPQTYDVPLGCINSSCPCHQPKEKPDITYTLNCGKCGEVVTCKLGEHACTPVPSEGKLDLDKLEKLAGEIKAFTKLEKCRHVCTSSCRRKGCLCEEHCHECSEASCNCDSPTPPQESWEVELSKLFNWEETNKNNGINLVDFIRTQIKQAEERARREAVEILLNEYSNARDHALKGCITHAINSLTRGK